MPVFALTESTFLKKEKAVKKEKFKLSFDNKMWKARTWRQMMNPSVGEILRAAILRRSPKKRYVADCWTGIVVSCSIFKIIYQTEQPKQCHSLALYS